MQESKRAIVYLEPEIHDALRIKAAALRCPVSEIVNDVLRQLLGDDVDDLAAFEERAEEPEISFDALLRDLKKHGKL